MCPRHILPSSDGMDLCCCVSLARCLRLHHVMGRVVVVVVQSRPAHAVIVAGE